MNEQYTLTAGQIFTLFFIMVGPFKIIGPFFRSTKNINSPWLLKKLSAFSVVLAAILFLICGYLGSLLMEKWKISTAVMTLTAGLVFGFVAFKMILSSKKEEEPEPSATAPVDVNPIQVAGSMIISPYGMATLIVFLATSQSLHRSMLVFAMLGLVLLFDFVTMIFIRQIMGKVGSLILMMLGFALGILQAALGVEIIYTSLQMLNVVT